MPNWKSNHNCTILKPSNNSEPNKIQLQTVRPLKESGIKGFGTWIQNQNWAKVRNSIRVQVKTDAFYLLLNEAVDSHFPKAIKE